MQLFIQEEPLDLHKDGFSENEIIDRTKLADQLSNLLIHTKSPLVVALDGPWGSGKSYFLKRWLSHHASKTERKSKVIYFDAFESDYLEDPLIPLTNALLEQTPLRDDKKHLALKLKKAGMKIFKPASRILLSAATGGASEFVIPAVNGAISATEEEINSAVEKYWSRENEKLHAVITFKNTLKNLLKGASDSDDGKIIFVIDELDRCRPDFALRILEISKHFFQIENVHFVLGINSIEFSNIIKKRYGDSTSGREYLEKFVSLYINIPKSTTIGGVEKDNSIPYILEYAQSLQLTEKDKEDIVWLISEFPDVAPKSLRQCQKILTELSILSRSIEKFESQYYGYRLLTISLLLLKHHSPRIFGILSHKNVPLEDVLFEFGLSHSEDMSYQKHSHTVLDHIYRSCIAPHTIPDEKNDTDSIWGRFRRMDKEDVIQRQIRDHFLTFSLGKIS